MIMYAIAYFIKIIQMHGLVEISKTKNTGKKKIFALRLFLVEKRIYSGI